MHKNLLSIYLVSFEGSVTYSIEVSLPSRTREQFRNVLLFSSEMSNKSVIQDCE
jgi:hypothetical protein